MTHYGTRQNWLKSKRTHTSVRLSGVAYMYSFVKSPAFFVLCLSFTLTFASCNKGGKGSGGAEATKSAIESAPVPDKKPKPTVTVTASATPAPTVTITASASPAPTVTATVTASPGPAPTVTATATVTPSPSVSPSPVYEALVASASVTQLMVGDSSQIVARGGKSPLTYSIASGPGSVDAVNGFYLADGASGAVSIKVKDALNSEVTVNLQVSAALRLISNKTYVQVNGTVSLITDGGIGAVTITKLSGGGSYDGLTQTYTAPASSDPTAIIPDVIVLQAMDIKGNHVERALLVYNTFAPIINRSTLSPASIASISMVGGLSPYTLVNSTGNIGMISGSGSTRTYQAPAVPNVLPQSGPVFSGTSGITRKAYFKFDETLAAGTPGNFLDSSGANLALSRSSISLTNASDGDGKAVQLTGSNYLYRENPLLNSGNFSLSLWVKRQATSNGALFYLGSSSVASKRFSAFAVDANLQVCATSCWTIPNVLGAQTWNQVAFSYASSAVKIFVNGMLVHSQNVTLDVGGGNFFLGAYVNGASPFDGFMDEVMLFEGALTSDQIASLYRVNQSVTLTATDSVGNEVSFPVALADRIRLKMSDDTHFGGQSVTINVSGGVGPYQLTANAGTHNFSANSTSGASGTFVAQASSSAQILVTDSQGAQTSYSTSTGTMVTAPSSVTLNPGDTQYFSASGPNSGQLFYSTTCPRTTFTNGYLTFLGGAVTQWCSVTISDTAGNYSSASVLLNLPSPYYQSSQYYFSQNSSGNQMNYVCPSGNCSHSSNDGNCSISDPGNNSYIELSLGSNNGSCEIRIMDNQYGTEGGATVYWNPLPYFYSDSYSTTAGSGIWADYYCPSGNCSFGMSGNCSFSYSNGSSALYYAGSGYDSCTLTISDNNFSGATGSATLSWSEVYSYPSINGGSSVQAGENSQVNVSYHCPSGNWNCNISISSGSCSIHSIDQNSSAFTVTTPSAGGSNGSCEMYIQDGPYGTSASTTLYYEASPYFLQSEITTTPGTTPTVDYVCPGGNCSFSDDSNQCSVWNSGSYITVSPYGTPSSCQPRITSTSGLSSTMTVVFHDPPPVAPTLNNGSDVNGLEGQSVTMSYSCNSGNCAFGVNSGSCSFSSNDSASYTATFTVNSNIGSGGSCSIYIQDLNYNISASINLNFGVAPYFEQGSYSGVSGTTLQVNYFCPSGNCGFSVDGDGSIVSGPNFMSGIGWSVTVQLPLPESGEPGVFNVNLVDHSASSSSPVTATVSYSP